MPQSTPPAVGFSPKFALLGFLYIRPMYGYELHKHLETSLREVWHISQSQAYNILKMLEKDKWVTITPVPQEKRPDKGLLTLTELGKCEFETWLYTPTPGNARAIRVEFITRLFFAANLRESLCLKFIQEQADSIRADLMELRIRSSLVPPGQIFNQMGLDLRIRQLEAILDWVERSSQYFLEDQD